ncbi:MAG: hypothetical protein KDH15_20240 [Rhodocyclaceae bacterium]|nr:hypothetical protein [Rhodocyclaceae bacterium]
MSTKSFAPPDGSPFGLAFRAREAAFAPPTALLVLLHGVGGNESNLAELAAGVEPGTLVVMPRGPLELGRGQYAWFNVAFTPSGPKIAADEAEASRVALIRFVEDLQAAHGIAPERTVVAGFSQGGILSASVALSAPQRVRGFAVLCGRILPELEAALAPPGRLGRLHGWIAHGREDTTLPVAWAHRADDWLERLGIPHQLRLYPGGHGLSAPMADDFLAWHRSLVAPRPPARLTTGGEHALLLDAAASDGPLRIAPGTDRLLREHFTTRVPLGVAMEAAIMAIEDELALVPASVRGIDIVSDSAWSRVIAETAGIHAEAASISRDAVEHVFSRQAAVAEGRPIAAEGLPDDPRFVAELLVLREIMHHLDIPFIQLGERGNSAPAG